MDKCIFLFSKSDGRFNPNTIERMTREQCENLAADPSYISNESFIKIDASDYSDERDAMNGNDFSYSDWHVRSFGLKQNRTICVIWDTDDEDESVDLPKKVDVPYSVEDDDIADWLSDNYGFCVLSLVIN